VSQPSPSPAPPSEKLDPEKVAAIYLTLYPQYETFRQGLVDLACLAWEGQQAFNFYSEAGRLLNQLPWLVDRWLNAELVQAIRYPPYPDFRKIGGMPEFRQAGRQRSRFDQLEGLLLLAKLEAPEESSARDLLSKILDLIDHGLRSNQGGTARMANRRHPLTDIFKGLGRPQTIEHLASALAAAIQKTSNTYPRFAQFLSGTFLNLVAGRPMEWTPPDDPADLLDVDRDPQAGTSNLIIPTPSLPVSLLKPFGASDLVEEMLVVATELESWRDSLHFLARGWRGEDTWKFFETVGRLPYWLKWLPKLLGQKVDVAALTAIREATSKSAGWQSFARRQMLEWRERNYFEPPQNLPWALFEPSDRHRRWGISHLRGLSLYARLEWGADKNLPEQRTLDELIAELQSCTQHVVLSEDLIASGIKPQHPLERILDLVGKPQEPAEFLGQVERLLPKIEVAHPEAARLLGDAYLPLLKGENVALSPVQPRLLRNRRTRATTGLRRIRIRLPTREEPQAGESPDEVTSSIVAYRRPEPYRKPRRLKEEMRWVQQRIWGTNPLLVRNHFESICDAEAALLVRALDSRILTDIDEHRADAARTGILLALTLLTGRGPRTWAATTIRFADAPGGRGKPQLHLQEGVFELPVLQPENSFKASKSDAPLLEQTVASIKLHLPPTLRSRIASLLAISKDSWSQDPVQLKAELEDYVSGLAPTVGTGITLSRIRNFARARLREVTADPSMTMILCGDSFGLSTAPLYYFNSSATTIEQSYRNATWPLFGDDPKNSVQLSDVTARVGSQLLVTSTTARELARTPGAQMCASGKRKREGQNLVTDHNALTNHILCMLMGVAAHRPTSALLELRRFDFDADLHAAIFRDKQCDPAHFFRFAPIADLVSKQMAHYYVHLRSLADLPNATKDLSERARSALFGESPLFFHLAPDRSAIPLELETWQETLPSVWHKLPKNWGRTFLASRGREAGIEADHICAALGHLEAIGYPFSRESPLEPAQLSLEIAAPLGRLARSKGWVARKGLRADGADALRVEELGQLKDWKQERNRLADDARAFQVEQRQVLRSELRSKREDGERVAHDALVSVLGQQIPEFVDITGRRPPKATPDSDASQGKTKIALTPEELERIQGKIDEAAKRDKVLLIAGHNALHRYLKNADKRLDWDCTIPSPWLSPPTLEPTPFFSGMLRASAQMRVLRDNFSRIPAKPPANTSFSEFEWTCGIAIISMCIFGFMADGEQILAVLRGRASSVRSSAIQDLLLVETDERRQAVGLRGLAAMALARLAKEYPSEQLPASTKLDEVLAAQIPAPLRGSATELFARLCATVAVTNIVELAGLARAAIDAKNGCVPMKAYRQRQFLEEGGGAVAPFEASATDLDADIRIFDHKCAPSTALRQFNQLSRALHIGEGPKTFEVTGETLSQANIVAFRGPLRRELEAFLAQPDLSPLVSCLGSFALHLTTHGTREEKEPAWSTVYKYINSFGAALVRLGGDSQFIALESEEYLDLYQEVLDQKVSDKRKALATRELVDFHVYLQEKHDVEVVDFSDIEGAEYRPEFQVDAELIQPQEFVQGLERMTLLASPTLQGSSGNPDRTRLDRQAWVFALLLRASGARHNELAALRFKDVLATLDCTVLFIRPSRYRRLKTPAARRIADCSLRISKRHRRLIAEWIAAEKARLGASWKATLPIFGRSEVAKEHVPSGDLRDATLTALKEPVGYRSKVHRVRHLVAAEDLMEIWLSDRDWRALRHMRARARRLVHRRPQRTVVLPRHLRAQSIRFGHRRASTTLLNYFHMPWATLSRPHATLNEWLDRRAAAVALGVSIAGVDKVIQRTQTSALSRLNPASIWISHVAGNATQTPGISREQLAKLPARGPGPIPARLTERVLRDIQRGLSITQACLVHGLGADQLELLKQSISTIERKTGFKILPSAGRKSRPRTARVFDDAKIAEGILNLMDEGTADDRQLIESAASAYLLWANKSKRDELMWPVRDIDRLVSVLTKIGVAASQISRSDTPEEPGFARLEVSRSLGRDSSMNHILAWMLVTVSIAKSINL